MKLQTPIDTTIQNCLVLPYYPDFGSWPNHIGDFVRPTHTDPYFGHYEKTINTTNLPIYNSQLEKKVWSEISGFLVFRLEIPGFGRENISVTIEDDGAPIIKVEGRAEDTGFTESYEIPDAKSVIFDDATTIIINGVLTVKFPKRPNINPKKLKLI